MSAQADFDFIEGFDLYPVGALDVVSQGRWIRDTGSAGGTSVQTSAPRNGRASFRSTSGQPRVWVSEIPTGTIYYICAAIRADSFHNNSMGVGLATLTADDGFSMGIDGNGFASVYSFTQFSSGGTKILTSGLQVTTGVYNFFEMVVDNTAGTTCDIFLYVNGQLVGSLLGTTPRGTFNRVCIKFQAGFSSDGSTAIDDICVKVDPSWLADVPLGDVAVINLMPDSDETPLDWTPSTGATNFGVINEAPLDTADYIEGANVNDESVVGIADYAGVNPIGFIHSIQSQYYAVDGSGASTMNADITLPVTGVLNGANKNLTTTGEYQIDIFSGSFDPADLVGASVSFLRTA